EAGWGGWSRERPLLEGKPWLDATGGGAGWYWLGRAREETGDDAGAADAYGRYLRASPASDPDGLRVTAELRHALTLLHAGRAEEGAAALQALRRRSPATVGWAPLLAAEALAKSGDTARVRELAVGAGRAAPPERVATALVDAYVRAGNPAAGRALALAELPHAATGEERAGVLAAAGRAAREARDVDAARADFRRALAASTSSPGAGLAAAGLEALGGLAADDRLAMAAVFTARGAPAKAAAQLRAWLALPGGTPAQRAQASFGLGRALFLAGSYRDAAATLAPLADDAAPLGPKAAYLLGRAQMRGAPGSASATFLALAARFPRSDEAAHGLFLAADAAQDRGDVAGSTALYRRIVAQRPDSWRAGQAAARIAGPALVRGDAAGAAQVWDGLLGAATDPAVQAQAAYWAGRAHLASGDAAGARDRFRRARQADPVSYYAVLAARRLNEPYWPARLAPAPAADASLARRAEESLAAADLLRDAGLYRDAEAEADRVVRRAGDDPGMLYALAEALVPLGFPVRSVRIARRLEAAGEKPNERLLRILYPYNYREMLAGEARERGLDPFLVAALTRQESVFEPRALSGAGARGLMQVMPSTGAGLAAGAGVEGWTPELLFNPEVNAHLGTRYLGAQMRRYDGKLPYVFSAYNAGEGRVRKWSAYPEARDMEVFTERIPFDETRDYVKILTRNIALYRGLYGG
ncbi:MAG TPA: transglycosylase SLT domain-containing protein, partial [Longimicrobiaceae bacterium]|nr:transglycosylase SLT domain-containing protein [Longimicrobiaceae bacterium]